MSVRYVLAPQAALDLVEIWRYIKNQASLAIADRVESAIREKIVFLAGTPGAGHSRKDLTGEDVKFFPIYSYLIVYRPQTRPLQVAAILHGRREAGAFRDREPPFSIDRSGYNSSLRAKQKTNVRLDEVGTDDFLLEHGSYRPRPNIPL